MKLATHPAKDLDTYTKDHSPKKGIYKKHSMLCKWAPELMSGMCTGRHSVQMVTTFTITSWAHARRR